MRRKEREERKEEKNNRMEKRGKEERERNVEIIFLLNCWGERYAKDATTLKKKRLRRRN